MVRLIKRCSMIQWYPIKQMSKSTTIASISTLTELLDGQIFPVRTWPSETLSIDCKAHKKVDYDSRFPKQQDIIVESTCNGWIVSGALKSARKPLTKSKRVKTSNKHAQWELLLILTFEGPTRRISFFHRAARKENLAPARCDHERVYNKSPVSCTEGFF